MGSWVGVGLGGALRGVGGAQQAPGSENSFRSKRGTRGKSLKTVACLNFFQMRSRMPFQMKFAILSKLAEISPPLEAPDVIHGTSYGVRHPTLGPK